MAKKRKIYTLAGLQLSLTALYNAMNMAFFNGGLEKVVITCKEGQKRGCYGWITTRKEWIQGKNERYEINISCDYLNRPLEEIAATLLHEMVHLYCMENGIKDTSRNGFYHNKKFRDAASAHHLITTERDKVGWNDSELDQTAKDWLDKNCSIKEICIRKKLETEEETEKKKKKSSTRKYICPICGMTVRATKDVNVLCGDCLEYLKKEEDEEDKEEEA